MNDKNILFDTKIISLIGRGSYGEIFSVKYGSKKYAVKKQKISNNCIDTSILSDMDIHTKFKNSLYIINVKYICFEDKYMYMYMELMDNSLYYFIYHVMNKQKEEQKQEIMLKNLEIIYNCLISGIGELHKSGISHNDIKPENVLIKYNEQYEITNVKICDFSLSRGINNYYYRYSYNYITIPFRPPELVVKRSNLTYSYWQNDIWSLGLTLYEYIYGYRYFDTDNENILINKIKESCSYKDSITKFESDIYNKNISGYELTIENIYNIPLKQMLKIEPTDRLNINEIYLISSKQIGTDILCNLNDQDRSLIFSYYNSIGKKYDTPIIVLVICLEIYGRLISIIGRKKIKDYDSYICYHLSVMYTGDVCFKFENIHDYNVDTKYLLKREKKIIEYLDYLIYNPKLNFSIHKLFSKFNFAYSNTDKCMLYYYLLNYNISNFKQSQDLWF